MEHVAIMNKSWNLVERVLLGEKTIESRWYQTKRSPWNNIKIGDTVYFKNSGEPVTVKTYVKRVIQYSNLTPNKIKSILHEYSLNDEICIKDIPNFFNLVKDKEYCILIALEKPIRIKPFNIDKKGFGNMSAWICMEDVKKIKIN